jgi:hypothetical protein
VEARLSYGVGRVTTISANRRGEGGTIDPDVPVVCFHRRDATPEAWAVDEEPPTETPVGGLIAVLFSFACHPVSLHSYRNLLSPDYVGYARAAVQALCGPETVALFAMGAAGDINQRALLPAHHAAPGAPGGRGAGQRVAQVALDPQFVAEPTLRIKASVSTCRWPAARAHRVGADHRQYAAGQAAGPAARW